jgi:hypothetical protein
MYRYLLLIVLFCASVTALEFERITPFARCLGNECTLETWERYYFNGTWNEWNRDLSTACRAPMLACSQRNPYNILLNGTTTVIQHRNTTIEFFLRDVTIGATPLVLNFSQRATVGNRFTFRGIMPDAWLEIGYAPEKTKINLVINQTTFYRLLPSGDNVTISFGVRTNASVRGGRELALNEDLFIQPVVIYDRTGRTIRLPFSIVNQSGETRYRFTLPLANLTNLSTPIVIDPEIRLTSNNNTYDGEVLEDTSVDDTATLMRAGVFCSLGDTIKTRAFLDWNLSLVPDHARIKLVNLTLGIDTIGDERTLNVTDMDGPAQGRSGASLYPDIVGVAYGRYNYSTSGSFSMILNNVANQTLQANLSSDVFSLGITTDQLADPCALFGDDATDIATREHVTVAARPQLHLVFNRPPNATLRHPLNATNHPPFVVLNLTMIDDDNDNLTGKVYVSPEPFPSLGYLVSATPVRQNGTLVSHNVTALPLQNQSRMLFLLHMDNNTDVFEPQRSFFADFTGRNNNFTAISGALPAYSEGKFAGGIAPFQRANIADRSFFGAIVFGIEARSFIFVENTTLSLLYNVSALCNPDDVGGWLYSQQFGGTGFGLEMTSCSALLVTSDAAESTLPDVFRADSLWHHLAFALRQDASYDVYVDGVVVASNSVTTITDNVAGTYIGTIIGAENTFLSFANFFNGRIDDVAVINRTLTPSEIRAIYELQNGTYHWYANLTDDRYQDTGRSELRTFCVNQSPCPPAAPAIGTADTTFREGTVLYPFPDDGAVTTSNRRGFFRILIDRFMSVVRLLFS